MLPLFCHRLHLVDCIATLVWRFHRKTSSSPSDAPPCYLDVLASHPTESLVGLFICHILPTRATTFDTTHGFVELSPLPRNHSKGVHPALDNAVRGRWDCIIL